MEKTARAIIKIDNEYVFMKRVKILNNMKVEYYTTIGGHLDNDETYEEACVREVYEELGVGCKIDRLLFEMYNKDIDRYEKFFSVVLSSKNITHGNGLEFLNIDISKYGTFEVVKIDKFKLKEYNILPIEIKKYICKL